MTVHLGNQTIDVEVLPFRPRDVISKREVDGGQYQIRIGGSLAGFVGYEANAPIRMHGRYSPMELDIIERLVQEKLPGAGGIRQPGITPPQPKPENFDSDFN